MPQLDARRTYSDGAILFAADLDAIIDDIETLLNSTKLNDDNIQDAGITGSTKLADATVTAGKLASNSVTTAKITDANVTTAKLADGAVTTVKITDANVTAAKLASDSVTTAKILDSNVTTAKIADSNVTTAKIADSNVTTAKIASGAVTAAKLAATNFAQSSACTSFSTSSSSFVDVTNLSVSLASTRHLHISIQSDSSYSAPNGCYVDGGSSGAILAIYRNSDLVGVYNFPAGSTPLNINHFNDPVAGTYTWKVQLARNSAGTVGISRAVLIVREIN